MILIFGSVPEALTKSLPLLFSKLFAFLIAFVHLSEFIIFLFVTLTLISF